MHLTQLTNSDDISVLRMKLFVIDVLFSLQRQKRQPKFGNSTNKWTRVLCQRMPRGQAVQNNGSGERCPVEEEGFENRRKYGCGMLKYESG